MSIGPELGLLWFGLPRHGVVADTCAVAVPEVILMLTFELA